MQLHPGVGLDRQIGTHANPPILGNSASRVGVRGGSRSGSCVLYSLISVYRGCLESLFGDK